MMAKMFYTLEETKVALGRNEEEIKQLTREGRLREYRDGPRLMFKADQVEALKGELGVADQVGLGADSGAPISIADSQGSDLGISLAESENQLSGSGMQMQMNDDTAIADVGLSGSVGGVPSPGRSGGSVSGMSATGTGRGGINVFGEDSVEHADPLAQTAISQPSEDQVNLESMGSGSGLLDLTRESDDTSLGAELLDEIAPATGKSARRAPTDSGVGTGLAEPRRGVTAPPMYVEAADAAAPAFGAMALAASIVVLVGALILTSAVMGVRPSLLDMIVGEVHGVARPIWMVFAGGAVIVGLFGMIGWFIGKRS